jgi:DNA-binding MarR family transcriptional regulator
MQPNNDIGYLLNHLSSVLARQSDDILQERLGFGMTQYKILTSLLWSNGMLQKQIAERLGLTEAGISRQMKIISDMKLLQVTINPVNKREHIIRLTARGEQKTHEAMNIIKDYHAPVFRSLGTEQQQALLHTLSTLHSATCSSGRAGACHHTTF